MFGRYFYHKNIRNIVILFGTIFNDIKIKRTLANGDIQNEFKVPISYGPSQKYLSKLEQGPIDEEKETIGITLPRLSFEIVTMNYDPTRKLQTTQKIREVKPLGTIDSIEVVTPGAGYTTAPTVTIEAPENGNTATATAVLGDGTNVDTDKIEKIDIDSEGSGYTFVPNVTITKVGSDNPTNATARANVDSSTSTLSTTYTPVPYNFDIDLAIMVKNSDDGAQILEQILPYFTPEFHVTLKEMKELGIKRDIPIIFNSMSTDDDYEGDFLTRRSLTHTLSFTVQGYLYGPSEDQGIIREVDVNAGGTFDDKDVNINIVPKDSNAEPDDAPVEVTTTITDL